MMSRQDGFSLLELLVVIAIIGILAAAALPRFAEYRAAAYDSRAQQDLRNLAAAQELYRARNEDYASAVADLGAFVASAGVEITVGSADVVGFTADSEHPAGSLLYSWDSGAEPPLSSAPR